MVDNGCMPVPAKDLVLPVPLACRIPDQESGRCILAGGHGQGTKVPFTLSDPQGDAWTAEHKNHVFSTHARLTLLEVACRVQD
jgi:hypothetical protein